MVIIDKFCFTKWKSCLEEKVLKLKHFSLSFSLDFTSYHNINVHQHQMSHSPYARNEYTQGLNQSCGSYLHKTNQSNSKILKINKLPHSNQKLSSLFDLTNLINNSGNQNTNNNNNNEKSQEIKNELGISENEDVLNMITVPY